MKTLFPRRVHSCTGEEHFIALHIAVLKIKDNAMNSKPTQKGQNKPGKYKSTFTD